MNIETKKLKTSKTQNDKTKKIKKDSLKTLSSLCVDQVFGGMGCGNCLHVTGILSETLDFPFAIGYHLQTDS